MRPKNITALGLLLLVALPLILSVGIFVKQKIVQFQRTERFKTEHLQTISLAAEKIFWVKRGKEILLHGKLFDVKSYRISGELIHLTGFYDHKEDKLVHRIAKLLQDEDDSSRPPGQFLVKFLCFAVYKEQNGFQLENSWMIVQRHFPDFVEDLSHINFPATLPPPEFC